MKKTLSKFVKENLGEKVLILKFNVEGEMDELELIENFEIDVIDTNQSQKENPLEEETLILSDFWY